MDTSKSSGLDKTGPNILKLCRDHVARPIATLINYSLSSGVFPDKLKEAGVVPLHKGESKYDPNNYRPISILPTLSKIFERHVANQLNKYLQNTNVLDERQSGFRQYTVNSWLTSMDEDIF